jgi:hypothetical protein
MRTRLARCGPVQTSATPELSLVKRLGQRFESARRLSRNIVICRKIEEMKEGPDIVSGPIHRNRSATRLTEGSLHSVGSIITPA